MNIYYGICIHKNSSIGHRLKYYAYTNKGMVAANTLQGIKKLIKEGRKLCD
jgi:hypothetical protein